MYILHSDLIRELAPDLVITQAHCEVCAVTPSDVKRSGVCGLSVDQLALSASTVEGIFEGVQQVADRIGLGERGRVLVERERRRLRAVSEQTARFRRPTVVMMEWTDPVFAMGNWGPELVEIANGELLLGRKGEYSAAIPAEQLRDADPEYLIVARCGFNLERALLDQPVLERHPWWRELQAVRNGNLVFADGNLFFNRSGMTISQTAEIIAEILHGVTFGTEPRESMVPGAIVNGARWHGTIAIKLMSGVKRSSYRGAAGRTVLDFATLRGCATCRWSRWSPNTEANRVAMHAVRRALVESQAERTNLPLWAVELPWPCSNSEYEDRMRVVCQRAVAEQITVTAFGDLFLQDIHDYRVRQLQGSGLEPLFPLWQIPTEDLALDMIAAGVKAKITRVDPSKPQNHLPVDFDQPFRKSCPESIRAGKNGEFHTFVHDAPVFSNLSRLV
jgi:iron complex transport system substrate-binding protein